KQFHKSSPKTYNNYRHNLSHLWQELSIDSGMTSNIWKLVSRPARMTGEVYRPFTDDEIQKILENSETFWRSASIISCHTGLRLKDIVLLEWKQIDFETKEIKLIPHKIARYNKTIAIPLHDDILAMLKDVPKTDKKYVFPEVIHRHRENSEFHTVFTNILETSGIKDNDKGIVGFHSWRKTFTTNASSAGIELEEIRKMVGHSKIEMTEHYDHSKVTDKLRNMKSITKVPNK
ncbi:MAG: site-specific integrase, partial [Victivallales bacterium]